MSIRFFVWIIKSREWSKKIVWEISINLKMPNSRPECELNMEIAKIASFLYEYMLMCIDVAIASSCLHAPNMGNWRWEKKASAKYEALSSPLTEPPTISDEGQRIWDMFAS